MGKKPEDFSRRTRLHILVLVFLGLLAYSNTFAVPFQFDDSLYIEKNILVSEPGAIFSPESTASRLPSGSFKTTVVSRYMGYLTFAFNYMLHGLDVWGYHAVNLAIHLINALLVYWLVLLTFSTPAIGTSIVRPHSGLIAFFSALLFTVHPVQTEAITYITQRFTSICAMFYVLSLALYVKARLSRGKTRYGFYAVSAASALAAMFTKEISFTLPLAIVLYDLLFFEGGWKERAKRLIPYLMLMPVIPLFYMNFDKPLPEAFSVATKTQLEITRWEYLLTQIRVMSTYIRLIVLPLNQNLDYDYRIFSTPFETPVLLSGFLVLTIAALGLYTLRRAVKGGEPALRVIAFGIFFYFLALSVESSLIALADVIFEHRLYMPMVGASAAITTGVFLLWSKMHSARLRALAATAVAVLLLAFSGSTYSRNAVWKDTIRLWGDVVDKSPQKARGYNNVAEAYSKAHKPNEALKMLLIARKLKPNSFIIQKNIAIEYITLDMPADALEILQTLLYISPNSASLHSNAGQAYSKMGLYEEALPHFLEALRLEPIPYNHNKVAETYNAIGDTSNAVEHYEASLKLSPYQFEIQSYLGILYKENGVTDKAIEHLEAALRLSPGNPALYMILADTYRAAGDIAKANEYIVRAKALERGSGKQPD